MSKDEELRYMVTEMVLRYQYKDSSKEAIEELYDWITENTVQAEDLFGSRT